MEKLSQNYMGVDVAKKHLDVHVVPTGKHFICPNNKVVFKKILKACKQFSIEKIACEASGGYELKMAQFLLSNNQKIWVVEPRRIKAFIRSEGVYAKTDKIDAKMIARFAEEKTCEYEIKPLDDESLNLRALVKRRDDLIEILKSEKNRLDQAYDEFCKKNIKKIIIILEKEIEQIDSMINDNIKKSKQFNAKAAIIQSMPGIGKISTAALLAYLPELGTIEGKRVSALVGVVPYNRESGSYRRKSFVQGGRSDLRKTLFMAALSASFSNPVFKTFYKRLLNAGKRPKTALVAVIRKMVVILNSMVRNNQAWNIIE